MNPDLVRAKLPSFLQLGEVGLKIALTIVMGFLAVRLLRRGLNFLEPLLARAGEKVQESPLSAGQRAATLAGVLHKAGFAGIWTWVAVTSLDLVGFDIRPVLASVGVLGLMIGLGAQSIVRDLVNGLFTLLENQIRVGDVAVINGTGGSVEAITFRVVVLRDQNAAVHYFPHGSIHRLSNLTQTWSAYLMDVRVAYKEDPNRVMGVMRDVDEGMRADPEFDSWMLQPIEIFGVDDFRASGFTLKARIKTQPGRQRVVGREYLRRLKQTFDRHGIEIPFPHRSLYGGEASHSTLRREPRCDPLA